MNQKLRTARSGIVILFAILSIVCLSVSLALSAHFAAYAEGETTGVSNELPAKDGKGNGLWQVHYTDDENNEVFEDLLDGKDENQVPLTYLGFNGSVTKGDDQLNYFAPYRGTGVALSVRLNPNYEKDGTKLSDLYNLDEAVYNEDTNAGGPNDSTDMSTAVTAQSKTEGGDALSLTKEWVIVPLCNEVVDGENYAIDSTRKFASEANYEDLSPSLEGSCIVYHFQSESNDDDLPIIAIRTEKNGAKTYLKVTLSNEGNYVIEGNAPGYADINDAIRHLDVGAYTLKVTATALGSVLDSDIYYAETSFSYEFTVEQQSIEGAKFISLFGSVPQVDVEIEYPCSESDLAKIGLKLSIGNVEMKYGKDYTLELSGEDVGMQNLRIIGNGNLTDEYVIERAVRVTPADNRWDSRHIPSIYSWSYGDYDKTINKIDGLPVYPISLNEENINDITFRIVSVDKDGVEHAINGLSAFHYVIDATNGDQYLVSDEVADLLGALHAGKYRMYARVDGADIGNLEDNRNYQPVEETLVEFEVRQGYNVWDSEKGVPNVVAWTAGKYDPAVNIITATDRFGNDALIVIQIAKNGAPVTVYSNHPEHANQDYGVYGKGEEYATKILKSLKAGYYTLRAEIKVEDGQADYNSLNTLIDFTIARNGLPTWAVILIVVGSLAIVAVIFVILHEKGVLQMLTGRVIISMRTRANVDATIAAIRAAKVAREAEASIAAAKAREAEEATNEKKD